ncbi:polysaccharide pyruvyl transferase family protein [Kangiella sediminilitoris]|uniref:ExoV-like protein n=1 Tax=Kangiella sediminilitoris TaxID=1144748 RepID=A0A1B3BAB3_9GAMM|nr:polysaccharide pyruvyl transferase family protein [Kangiella sediminilitoris]AOE49751.1 ExoV-like protein [Kangiella sediminilitoris]
MTFFRKILGPAQNKPSELPHIEGEQLYCNYFEKTPNWGDSINKYLLERISGKDIKVDSGRQHILGVGSILRQANSNSIVWGSGFISKKGNIKCKPLKVCAVRGPLTRKLLRKKKIDAPEVYGDPALLMPRFYFPNIEKQYTLGVVPHYRDKDHPLLKKLASEGAKILDISKSSEAFIDDLLECKNVISSSLHGLIASDSYGIPNQWVKFSNELTGGGFKFQDYYHSIEQYEQRPIPVEELTNMSLTDIVHRCQLKPITLDLDKLLQAFPAAERQK